MLSSFDAGIVLATIGALFSAPASSAVNAADQTGPAVPVDELKNGLMSALGESFEYLGGELGRTRANVGSWAAERFWFAKVRPKTAGEFAVSCSIRFEFPDDVKKKLWRTPDRAVYTIPFTIGHRGAPRVVLPGSQWGGSTYPHVNVGDSLVIPIHVDRFRAGHTFRAVRKDDRSVASFFRYAAERRHEDYLKQGSQKPVVRNDAADRLNLLASWGRSSPDRPLRNMHHSLTAYLEFKRPGEFNLAARLADAEEKDAGDGVAIRVLEKDQPVTVVLEYLYYTDPSSSSGHVPAGTIEARVGDRVVLGCGSYRTPVKEKQDAYRPGVVVLRPFTAVAPYTPEPQK